MWKKKLKKNTSYLVIFAPEYRVFLEASRNFRWSSHILFSMDLKNLSLYLTFLNSKLGAVPPVSALFLGLLLVDLSLSLSSAVFCGINKQQQKQVKTWSRRRFSLRFASCLQAADESSSSKEKNSRKSILNIWILDKMTSRSCQKWLDRWNI